MAIRLRIIDGHWVAVCAAKTDPKKGDVYLDDAQHEALATKFAVDYERPWANPEKEKLMKKEEGDRGDELRSKCHPAVKVYFRQIGGKGKALPH